LKVEALDFNSQNTHVFKGSSEYVILLFLERFLLVFHDSTWVSFSMEDIPSIAFRENDGKLEQASKLEVA
jgi:hypothetical protein